MKLQLLERFTVNDWRPEGGAVFREWSLLTVICRAGRAPSGRHEPSINSGVMQYVLTRFFTPSTVGLVVSSSDPVEAYLSISIRRHTNWLYAASGSYGFVRNAHFHSSNPSLKSTPICPERNAPSVGVRTTGAAGCIGGVVNI